MTTTKAKTIVLSWLNVLIQFYRISLSTMKQLARSACLPNTHTHGHNTNDCMHIPTWCLFSYLISSNYMLGVYSDITKTKIHNKKIKIRAKIINSKTKTINCLEN